LEYEPDHYRVGVTEATRRADTTTRRYKVTPELLAEVLELNERGGACLVVEKMTRTERSARRLIARARDELGR
jgi:hypothetical protein